MARSFPLAISCSECERGRSCDDDNARAEPEPIEKSGLGGYDDAKEIEKQRANGMHVRAIKRDLRMHSLDLQNKNGI